MNPLQYLPFFGKAKAVANEVADKVSDVAQRTDELPELLDATLRPRRVNALTTVLSALAGKSAVEMAKSLIDRNIVNLTAEQLEAHALLATATPPAPKDAAPVEDKPQ